MQTQTSDTLKGNILIVDDDLSNLHMLVAVLTKSGHEIRTARNGEIALKTINAELPDLILLDIDMPGMDGFDVCRRLKDNPSTQNIPVIFLTGRQEKKDESLGLELGAVDYIRKPFSRDIVLARVRSQLELKKYRDQLEEMVKERTFELVEANNALKKEMADRIRLEEERKEVEMKAMAQDKLATLGAVAAAVAHEINQPLTFISAVIQTTIEKLENNNIDPARLLTKFKKAEYQVARILDIATHLRTVGRAEDPQPSAVNLLEILDNSLMLMQERMKHRNIVLHCKIPDDTPVITGMPGKLEQVFINLLTNAVDALEKQDNGEITVEMFSHPDQIIISFSDNGCGMVPKIRKRIFDPFFTTKEHGKGTGLGMPIIKTIIEEHKGAISCQSRPGKGTTFTIMLPVK